ncbi:MAG: hypothetical protein FRX49_00982 [Trebouxia sp. A1-2]|nr:MAG: hypothetical protein FRX49_00982 [Trebouxia sp. A1-2]
MTPTAAAFSRTFLQLSSAVGAKAASSSTLRAPASSKASRYGPHMHSSPFAPIGWHARKAIAVAAAARTWPAPGHVTEQGDLGGLDAPRGGYGPSQTELGVLKRTGSVWAGQLCHEGFQQVFNHGGKQGGQDPAGATGDCQQLGKTGISEDR